MLGLREASQGNCDTFKWGAKLGVREDMQLYESFTYEGQEYFIHDSVYIYIPGAIETQIGKLVRLYETLTFEKKIKVVWFFRPCDIRDHLGGYQPIWNELFLACGKGKGLANVIHVELIVGKCKVICASCHERNPRPSKQQLRMADFIFYRAFHVGTQNILEKFPDEICGVKVERFFNERNRKKLVDPQIVEPNKKELTDRSLSSKKLDRVVAKGVSSSPRVKELKTAALSVGVHEKRHGGTACGQKEDEARQLTSDENSLSSRVQIAKRPDGHISNETLAVRSNKRSIDEEMGPSITSVCQKNNKAKRPVMSEDSSILRGPDSHAFDMEKNLSVQKASMVLEKVDAKLVQSRCMNTAGRPVEVPKRPDDNKRRWFNLKDLPWGERIQKAYEEGALVSLGNLDPSFTPSEVEDLVRTALSENVHVKMSQHFAFCSPHHGSALVIFKSKESAEAAISTLTEKCLMLENNRPVVATKGAYSDLGKCVGLTGHLTLENYNLKKQSEHMRKAISTSHFAQSNTIEYDMAIEWCILQEKLDLCRKDLHKRQEKEMATTSSKVKMV